MYYCTSAKFHPFNLNLTTVLNGVPGSGSTLPSRWSKTRRTWSRPVTWSGRAGWSWLGTRPSSWWGRRASWTERCRASRRNPRSRAPPWNTSCGRWRRSPVIFSRFVSRFHQVESGFEANRTYSKFTSLLRHYWLLWHRLHYNRYSDTKSRLLLTVTLFWIHNWPFQFIAYSDTFPNSHWCHSNQWELYIQPQAPEQGYSIWIGGCAISPKRWSQKFDLIWLKNPWIQPFWAVF